MSVIILENYSFISLFPGLPVYKLSLIFGIHDRLVVIEPIITGHQKTDAVTEQEIGNGLITEQFK